MKYILFLICFSVLIASCDSTTQLVDATSSIALLPHPKEISVLEKQLILSMQSAIYTSNDELEPLLVLFQTEIEKISGVYLEISNELNKSADIQFAIDSSLSGSEYLLTITESIKVRGGSYQALAMGKTTLLQLLDKREGHLAFPMVTIKDNPDASYRGLLIDLARKWHSVSTVKQMIDMSAFYKSNYLQLHFTDYQSYTLPSNKYPKLPTEGRSYSFDELKELEDYASVRGVTIIPELEIPGHSSPFVEQYPEIFAISEVDENPYIINMGKEEAYVVLDEIIGELTSIFKSSPYFHIGGDEAYFHKVIEDPDVQEYMKTHELGEDVHELYRHFIVRLNDIVKKHGKQMCIWEGFRREGKIDIPKDILVFEFETNRYLPNHLIEDGYTVVNTSWKPLYVVNQKKWEPKTIYNWNVWRWENWFSKAPSIVPIQLEETPLIIGAEMCSWEQAEIVEVPSLRKRLPALNERIWNIEQKLSYEEFMSSLNKTDQKLSLLIGDDRQDDVLLDHNFSEEDLKK